MCRTVSGAPGRVTPSAGANTWPLETAATEIASGAVPGEPAVEAEIVAVVAGCDHRDDAGGGDVPVRTSTIASFAGSVCGPPPEKLITFMPSLTACSNAAAMSGDSAMLPAGVGTLKTR